MSHAAGIKLGPGERAITWVGSNPVVRLGHPSIVECHPHRRPGLSLVAVSTVDRGISTTSTSLQHPAGGLDRGGITVFDVKHDSVVGGRKHRDPNLDCCREPGPVSGSPLESAVNVASNHCRGRGNVLGGYRVVHRPQSDHIPLTARRLVLFGDRSGHLAAEVGSVADPNSPRMYWPASQSAWAAVWAPAWPR